jgi:hypothetical protein
LVVSGLEPAALRLTPSIHDFPDTVVGATTTGSDNQVFTLTNTGDLPSGTPIATLTKPTGTDFSIADNNCATALPAGASCTIGVVFAPSSIGQQTNT